MFVLVLSSCSGGLKEVGVSRAEVQNETALWLHLDADFNLCDSETSVEVVENESTVSVVVSATEGDGDDCTTTPAVALSSPLATRTVMNRGVPVRVEGRLPVRYLPSWLPPGLSESDDPLANQDALVASGTSLMVCEDTEETYAYSAFEDAARLMLVVVSQSGECIPPPDATAVEIGERTVSYLSADDGSAAAYFEEFDLWVAAYSSGVPLGEFLFSAASLRPEA